jgi:uncharacterized membrane protein
MPPPPEGHWPAHDQTQAHGQWPDQNNHGQQQRGGPWLPEQNPHRHPDDPRPDDVRWQQQPDPRDAAPPPRRRRGPIRSHGHSHAHDGEPIEVSARTRRVVTAILIPAAVLTAIAVILLWPGKAHVGPQDTNNQQAYGDVTGVDVQPCPPSTGPAANLGPTACGNATVQVTEGPGAHTTVVVALPNGPGAPTLAVGDAVVLSVSQDPTTGLSVYAAVDHQRGKQLVFMLALCAAVILAFGRWRGLTAMIALGVSFLALLFFVIPAILNGEQPLLVAVVGAIAVMFAVLYLTHGVNVHTSVAILGTLLSLILTGLFGYLFTVLTKLTGFGSEESIYLSMSLGKVDVRGLLLAGIIIGALGVLDDVTITQSSTVEELAVTATSRWELYRAATRVGRNHIASAVNTIVMAYAGASLPLLLLIVAGGRPAGQVVTTELIAQEIVRSAVGTIGLVASVPITTGLAALVADLRHTKGQRRPARAR